MGNMTNAVKLFIVAGLATAININAQACGPTSSVRPAEIASRHFRELIEHENFSQLEREAAKSLSADALLSDGQPIRDALTAGAYVSQSPICGDAKSADPGRIKLIGPFKAKLRKWLHLFPTSSAAIMANASFELGVAEIYRGTEYARYVSQDAWRSYYSSLDKAKVSMLAVPKKVRQADPEWYTQRLVLAAMQNVPEPEFRALYREALSAHPYYIPIYFAASNHFSPVWGGTPEDYDRFVQDAVRRTRDRLGETMYARLYWAWSSDDMFSSGAVDWNRMREGFREIVKRYPDPWNYNNFGRFACLAGDMATVAETLPHIGNGAVEAWHDMRIFADCRRRALEFTKKGGH